MVSLYSDVLSCQLFFLKSNNDVSFQIFLNLAKEKVVNLVCLPRYLGMTWAMKSKSLEAATWMTSNVFFSSKLL